MPLVINLNIYYVFKLLLATMWKITSSKVIFLLHSNRTITNISPDFVLYSLFIIDFGNREKIQ